MANLLPPTFDGLQHGSMGTLAGVNRGHHHIRNLDIELPTHMAFNRLHAQHTSWLVPLCLDGAFNEEIIDFRKEFAQQQCVHVMVFECAAMKSAEEADQVGLAQVSCETVTVGAS